MLSNLPIDVSTLNSDHCSARWFSYSVAGIGDVVGQPWEGIVYQITRSSCQP